MGSSIAPSAIGFPAAEKPRTFSWHGADWRFVVWGGLHGLMLVAWRIWWWQVGKPRTKDTTFARKFGGWFVMFNAVVLVAEVAPRWLWHRRH